VQVECNVSGLTTSHAPKETANLGGKYTVPTPVGKFGLSVNYSLMTKFYYDVADRLSQGGYGLLNAQLAWTLPSDRFTVALYGENLANKEYTVAQYAQAGLGDNYVAGTPRMYGVELRAKF
jgi:iron complex outermembrane receptor protein